MEAIYLKQKNDWFIKITDKGEIILFEGNISFTKFDTTEDFIWAINKYTRERFYKKSNEKEFNDFYQKSIDQLHDIYE